MTIDSNVEALLSRWQDGDLAARDELVEILHAELAQIASARLRRENEVSLATGDLVNDAVVLLIQNNRPVVGGRAHFLALASRVMRNVLIDHARAKATNKRQHHKVELCTDIDGGQQFDLIAVNSALIRLGAIDTQLMELVEMRYFGGMTIGDCATVLGLSETTLKRRWRTARAWLTMALAEAQ